MNRSFASRTARRALAAAIALAFAAGSQAAVTLPTGPVFTAGTATFTPGTDTLTMDQVVPLTDIQWTSFSIGAGGTLVFNLADDAITRHSVATGGLSRLDGAWLGHGSVTFTQQGGSIGMSGTYAAAGSAASSFALYAGTALEFTGGIATHGGDVTLNGGRSLVVDGNIDLGTGKGGTLHLISGSGLAVWDSVTTVMDPATGAVIGPGGSQVSTRVLSNAHGNVELTAGEALGVYAGFSSEGSISLHATGIELGTGDSLDSDAALRAGTAGGPAADILLHSDSYMIQKYGVLLSATGKVRIEAPTGSADLLGTIAAPRVELEGWRFDQTQQYYGGSLVADVLSGSADTFYLQGNNNAVARLSNISAYNFYLINNTDITGDGLVVTDWLNLDARGHDITLDDPNNRISALSARGRHVTMMTGPTVHLIDIDADALSVTADGDIDNHVGVDTSLAVRGDTVLKSLSGRIELAGQFGGRLDATTYDKDVWISGTLGGTTQIFGGDVRLMLSGRPTVGFVSGSQSVLLDSGIDPSSVITVDNWITTPLLKTKGNVVLQRMGPLPGAIAVDGELTFAVDQQQTPYSNNPISGTGTLVQAGPGTVILNGAIDGVAIRVDGGHLLLGDGDIPPQHVTSNILVNANGTLSGSSLIDGAVSVAAGGALAPGNGIGAMQLGQLDMAAGSHLYYSIGSPAPDLLTYGQSDTLSVHGNVTFNGPVALSIDNSGAGYFAPGFYHVLDYAGALAESGGGLQLDATSTPLNFTLLRDTANKRIDLLYTPQLLAFNAWNANGHASGSAPGGGSGTWTAASHNWATLDGAYTGPFAPRPSFAIFAGEAGRVTVDGSAGAMDVTGMQFLSDGYRLDGGPIHLVASNGVNPVIRVGDSASAEGITTTIANDLTGTAGLIKSDGGTLVLGGDNRWTGGTMITGGKLGIASAANLGLGDVTLAGGTLQVRGTGLQGLQRQYTVVTTGGIDVADAANTFSIGAGALKGSGQFIKEGAGTLVLAGSNGFSGRYLIRNGTLRADAAALMINGVDIAGTLDMDQQADGYYFGALSGNGTLVKHGQGTLTYAGNAQALSGHINVAEGRLVFGSGAGSGTSTHADITVAEGAVLAGNGTTGSVAVHGYLDPAAPGERLSIDGDLTMARGSTLMIDTSADGQGNGASAGVHVSGRATIDGARLVLDAQGARWVADQQFVILDAAGGVSGTFASINSNFAFLNTLVAYSSTGNISLILQRNAAALEDVAATPNQRAVAIAAGALGAGHAVYDRLVALDAGAARLAFTLLSGTLHASVQGAVMDSQRQVRDAVTRHLADADLPGGQRADDGRVSTWISALGRDADYDGDANAAKADASDSGLLLGADLAVGQSGRIGVVLGHVTQNIHERSSRGSADVKGTQFGLYGDVAFDALRLSGGLVQAHHTIDTRRDIAIGTTTTRGYASHDADTTQGFAELGYGFGATGRWKAEPFVQAAVVHWHGDKASEQGGTGTLVVGADDAHVTTGRAGVHLGTALDSEARFGVQATFAWQHAWGDTVPEAHLRFAEGGAGFTTAGAPLARNAGVVDAGLVVRLAPAVHLDASYTGQFASKASDHGGRLSLNMTF